MPIGALIGGGLSLLGSLGGAALQSGASQQSAQQIFQAIQQAEQEQNQMFGTAKGALQPWQTAGTNSLNSLQSALGIGSPTGPGGIPSSGILAPGSYQQSPGYQFALQQGNNQINNNAAATGNVGGNQLKTLQTYGVGAANQDYNQWLQNYAMPYISQLQGASGQGLTAAGGIANAAVGTGQAIAGDIIGGGNALAAGTMGSANALTSGLGALGGLGNQSWFQNLFSGGGSGSGGNPFLVNGQPIV